jgi:hypothetical protein
MNTVDRVVRAAVFELLATGSRDPTPSELAIATGLTVDAVAGSLNRLSVEHRLVLSADGDRVVMAHPFSSVSTDYQSQIGDRVWWANCAWDAFGILALLGDGRVVATSPSQPESVWTVSDGVVAPDGLVHFVVPARRFWDDIGFT